MYSHMVGVWAFFSVNHKNPLRMTEVFLWIIPCIVWPGWPEARRAQGRPLTIGIWSLHCPVKAGGFWPPGHIINLCYSFTLLLLERVVDSVWFQWNYSAFFNFSYVCIKHITWKHLYPGNTIQVNSEDVKVENGFDFIPICTIECNTAGYTV